jgi:hypothetical protein
VQNPFLRNVQRRQEWCGRNGISNAIYRWETEMTTEDIFEIFGVANPENNLGDTVRKLDPTT